ncbi:hypothetical protein QWZ08_13200 [Ferruginibacter paludis]|uniref:hypothetical protein n=1 Tax=Ferruginibacter paludis TaxID=1310417 RepID=UPI0025B528CA|nr:hypothetical protein [Ferruginibacter paludis]MDN3656595.1 hypothetical protein [Ferruginibacter paludis]
MKYLKKLTLVAMSAILSGGCSTPSYIAAGVQYSNPSWAPPYSEGVRYYYLPDIEVYYDLSDPEFIYLDNGQWSFSPLLPPIYAGYDLFNSFVISLQWNVYQPWMHHQYYVAHYPRYYYHNIYPNNFSTMRGFNENDRHPVYRRPEDRDKMNDLRKIEIPRRNAPVPRQPQAPHYYGKDIGRPVKVRPQMKENKQERKKIVRPQ